MCRSPHGVFVTSASTFSTCSPAAVEAVVEADRVEQVPEGAHVGEQPHGPVVLDVEVVRAPKPRRGRPPRRPQRHAVEHLRQLVEVEVAHEQAVAELVLDRLVAAVPDPALVERARASRRANLPKPGADAQARRPRRPRGSRSPSRRRSSGCAHPAHLVPAPLRGQAGRACRPDGRSASRGSRESGSIASVWLSVTQNSRSSAQRLQAVHVVGDRRPARPARPAGGSSSSPRRAAARQQRAVGVQHRLVRLVGDRAQHLGLGLGSGRASIAAPGRSGRRESPRRSARARRRPA